MYANHNPMTTLLSKSFTLEEFIHSNTAVRRGIANTPLDWHIANMRALCVNVLQPLRDFLDEPIHISSGFRSKELNDIVGGSETSQHSIGEAADIWCHSKNPKQLCDTIIGLKLPYDQLILEYWNPSAGLVNGWTHVSFTDARPNRKSFFTIP